MLQWLSSGPYTTWESICKLLCIAMCGHIIGTGDATNPVTTFVA